MVDHGLDALSLPELEKLQADIARTISTSEDRLRGEARERVESLARELGFTVSELFGLDRKSPAVSAKTTYHHPKNPELVWTGRGRRPQWFVAALAAGWSIEDLIAR